jgi:SAM-dependent methyltransferase
VPDDEHAGSPWYATFFDEDYLRTHRSLTTPEQTEREVLGIVQRLGLPAGSKILDLCCGSGRHSIPLAALGYDVTGLDLSRPLLRRAKAAARASGVAVRWVHGDMRHIPYEGEFSAVINIFNSFGYLENEEEDGKVLRETSGALAPGGLFLLDTAGRDSLARHFVPAEVERFEDGLMLVQEQSFDTVAGRLHVRVTLLHANGSATTREQSIRLYTPTELAGMLAAAGFSLEAAYGDLDGSPLTLESRHMVLLARKG